MRQVLLVVPLAFASMLVVGLVASGVALVSAALGLLTNAAAVLKSPRSPRRRASAVPTPSLAAAAG